MKSKRNILFAIILFTAAIFCFEANTHALFNSPLCNVENASGTNNAENNSNSSSESFEDYQVNFTNIFFLFDDNKYQFPLKSILISNYLISIWQPPKFS
jgi:hypothetical protein